MRKAFCTKVPSVVLVENIGGGVPNDCAGNALTVTETSDEEVHSVTGWLVHPYNSQRRTTQIVQHWWNKQVNGKHFDTTPLLVDDCEYIMDMDLIKFVIENFDGINSNVGTSILLHNSGQIEAYEADPSVPFIGAKKVNLTSLSTRHIYGLN